MEDEICCTLYRQSLSLLLLNMYDLAWNETTYHFTPYMYTTYLLN